MFANECATWGPLMPPHLDHMDCLVVIQHQDGRIASSERNKPIPRICSCECTTCKRAWWNAGRPILQKDGTISRKYE